MTLHCKINNNDKSKVDLYFRDDNGASCGENRPDYILFATVDIYVLRKYLNIFLPNESIIVPEEVNKLLLSLDKDQKDFFQAYSIGFLINKTRSGGYVSLVDYSDEEYVEVYVTNNVDFTYTVSGEYYSENVIGVVYPKNWVKITKSQYNLLMTYKPSEVQVILKPKEYNVSDLLTHCETLHSLNVKAQEEKRLKAEKKKLDKLYKDRDKKLKLLEALKKELEA